MAVADAWPAADRAAAAVLAPRARASGRGRRDRGDLRRLAVVGLRADQPATRRSPTSRPSSGPGSWGWERSSPSAARPLRRRDPGLRLVVAVAGLAGVLVSLFVVALVPGFSGAVGAAADPLHRCRARRRRRPHEPSLLPLTNPVSQYLGNISYSLYLWHFPVVVLIVAVVPQYSAAYWVVGLALIFGLSAASFHLLEDPARRGTWFRSARDGSRSPRSAGSSTRPRARPQRCSRQPLCSSCEQPSRPDSCCRRPSWSDIPRTIRSTASARRRSTRAITARG